MKIRKKNETKRQRKKYLTANQLKKEGKKETK